MSKPCTRPVGRLLSTVMLASLMALSLPVFAQDDDPAVPAQSTPVGDMLDAGPDAADTQTPDPSDVDAGAVDTQSGSDTPTDDADTVSMGSGGAVPGLTLPAMDTRAAPASNSSGGGEDDYIATEKTLRLIPGVNQIIPIAKGHLNRIITPFADPVIHTTSTAQISTKGSILYVATTSSGPTTMYVSPEGNDRLALSLTLVPRAIPPREISIEISGQPANQRFAPERAGEWERARPYVQSIKSVMRDLALGQVPPGYGMHRWKADDPAIVCSQSALSITPGQVLEGNEFILLVGVVTNTSDERVEINEARCRRPGVLAISTWPYASLPAGGQTEIYLVMRRPSPADDPRERPSLIHMGG